MKAGADAVACRGKKVGGCDDQGGNGNDIVDLHSSQQASLPSLQ